MDKVVRLALEIADIVAHDDSLVGLCQSLQALSKDKLTTTNLDLSGTSFLHIGQIALLAMYGQWASERHDSWNLLGVDKCEKIHQYNVALTEEDLDLDGSARPNRPYYRDDQGLELEDLYDDDILW